MRILNDIINDFQKEKLNAQYLKDYDYDFIDDERDWTIINGVIDLLQGVTSSGKDLVIIVATMALA